MANPEPEAEQIDSMELSSMVQDSILIKTENVKVEETDLEKNEKS